MINTKRRKTKPPAVAEELKSNFISGSQSKACSVICIMMSDTKESRAFHIPAYTLHLRSLSSACPLPGASVRNSAHGKGHEEGGLAYAKVWSSLRKPPVPEHLTPKPESVLCSHLHFWLYGGLSPITVSLREGVNVQLQDNKNSWAWQECFSLRTPLKVI